LVVEELEVQIREVVVEVEVSYHPFTPQQQLQPQFQKHIHGTLDIL